MGIWDSYQENILNGLDAKVKGHDVPYYQKLPFPEISKAPKLRYSWEQMIRSITYVNEFTIYIDIYIYIYIYILNDIFNK